MLMLWGMLIATNQVVEWVTEPYRITAHIASELIVAVFLIAGGSLSLRKNKIGIVVQLIAMGMLMNSVLNAGGYYLQKGEIAMTIMFAVLLFITLIFIIYHMIKSHEHN